MQKFFSENKTKHKKVIDLSLNLYLMSERNTCIAEPNYF